MTTESNDERTNAEASIEVRGHTMPRAQYTRVSDFVQQPATPGNVGICFSGGGSVAMMSALGQLRALSTMQVNGTDVISQAMAISTVSGGSWAVVPFTYLPDAISDSTFLGTYVDNPHDLYIPLIPKRKPDPADLTQTPDGYMGKAVAADGIKWTNMAVEAGLLLLDPLFPDDRIWTYLVAKHILEPFGLARVTTKGETLPAIEPGWFAYSKTAATKIADKCPGLANITPCVYQSGAGRIRRPYHLCNTAMFITPDKTKQAKFGNALAPVQSTAVGTGIFATGKGTPDGSSGDAAQQVGGGLVPSYAFNSRLESVGDPDPTSFTAQVAPGRTFCLADITAASSAFFATAVPELGIIGDPKFMYWPVANPDPGQPGFETRFGDGGCIEDNGLLNLLAYDDIHKAIVFTNALAAVWLDKDNPNDLNHMNVVVDPWIPTLFGYTPYQALDRKGKVKSGLGVGYHRYKELDKQGFDYTGKNLRYFRHNKIFEPGKFPDFLRTIWRNCNEYGGVSYYHETRMPVVHNGWFDIKPRDIELLLIHYGPYKPFMDSLREEVKLGIAAYVLENQLEHRAKNAPTPVDGMFPNFVLNETHMPPRILNLFAHFTSHVAMSLEDKITGMFKTNS